MASRYRVCILTTQVFKSISIFAVAHFCRYTENSEPFGSVQRFGGANVFIRSYTTCRMSSFSLSLHQFLLACRSSRCALCLHGIFRVVVAFQFFCENNFEGGGWALVRRVKQGSKWHPATDNLAGNDFYGTAGSSTSDSTFSLPFAYLISNETLLLLASGMKLHVLCFDSSFRTNFLCM